MADTQDTPPNTEPQTPAPPPPPDALQQYRIEQLEKALEKLQKKQDAARQELSQQINTTINQQTSLYRNHLDTLSRWGAIISLVFALATYFGGKEFIEKSVEEKIDSAVKIKVAKIDKQLAEYSAKQIEQGKEIEALKRLDEGNREYEKRNINDAIRAYGDAISIKPDYAMAYNNRGRAKTELGKYKDALEDLNAAIHFKPNFAEAYNNRGFTKGLMGKRSESIEDYNEAIRLKPNYADAYNNRGVSKAKLGQTSDALDDYNKAIQLKPNHASAYNNLGLLMSRQKKYEEAKKNYDLAIKYGLIGDGNFNKACDFALLGKKDEALIALKLAIDADVNFRDMAIIDSEDFASLRNDPRFKKLVGLE